LAAERDRQLRRLQDLFRRKVVGQGVILVGFVALVITMPAGLAGGAVTTRQTRLGAVAVRAATSGAIAEAPQPDGRGFWSVTPDGTVTAYGAARYEGGTSGVALNAPILAIASTPDGQGYWLVAADGGIFSFGDARFYGSTGDIHLNQPVVGMAPTPDGRGYWLVASDGGIFSFGDARFYGSTGDVHLNQRVVGIAPAAEGRGYWLVAADGGIFSFGDARFYGSTGDVHLDQPMVGMAATSDDRGYWLVAADGGIFTFGDAPFYGSATGHLSGGAAVGIVATAGGYWVATTSGDVWSFGDAPTLPRPPSPVPEGAAGVAGAPLANISPSPAFDAACYAVSSATCNSVALQAIDAAHGAEGLPALQLPPNYTDLSEIQQLVAVTNAERVERGLPVFAGPVGSLDSLAQEAALTDSDPYGPAGTAWGANWGEGFATPLAADFIWMYDDGIGSSNLDCTPSEESACWGHRDNILSPSGGSMGAAFVTLGASNSLTELFVDG